MKIFRLPALLLWKLLVKKQWPKAQFTQEDGTGNTYGSIGEWIAHTGPDMQADAVGVFGYYNIVVRRNQNEIITN